MNQKQVNHSPLYPYEEWSITERSFDVETNLQDETIFALGNGYIGMRGNFEEGYGGPDDTTVQGTYINGFYESEPIHYPEGAYGYAKYSQTMLNVTHAKAIELMIGDEPFQLGSGQLLDYERKLDLRRGLLTRRLDWQSPAGKQVRIVTKRLVSLVHQHLAAISYEVTPLNFTARIKVTSSMDGAVTNQVTMGDPRAGSGFRGQVLLSEHYWSEGTYSAMRQRTKQTKFALQCSTEHQYCGGLNVDVNIEALDQRLNTVFECDAALLQPFRLEKFISYCTSRDVPETELQTFGREVVENARRKGFAALADEQRAFLDHYWSRSDVIIEGDTAVQQSIRFNAFQLLQAAGRDGRTNIGAKGLTGEGYEGHYFWDTETYMLPFFIYTHPDISRRLLEYRYRTLDQARERAAEMSQRGALYPWRTINGEETSAYYPAGTAQAHINADIMYGMKRYMEATEDVEFLLQSGAEMLFETARFWEDLGDYIPSKGNRFCINGVTGPDEYTAVVDNNAFTNLMAKDHLLFAVHIAELLQLQHTDDFQRIADKISLLPSEIDAWRQAAKRMYVPYDEGLGITPQDDGFLSKARWDFAGRPKDKYPLLLHYHPLVIYRHQVLKQADVVLALWLQGSQFTKAENKLNFDYYEPLTTHDSSLSPAVHGIIAAELGYKDKAYDYFMRTARMDLDDVNGNVKDGVHTAAMAGSWLAIVYGFAGLREKEGILHFQPQLPKRWHAYQFRIAYQQQLVEIRVETKRVVYKLLDGELLHIKHGVRDLRLVQDEVVVVDTTPLVEAVIFDLDGVITDTAEYHYQAWKELADALHIPFDRGFNEKLKGIGRMESLQMILDQGNAAYSEAERLELANKKNERYVQLLQQVTRQDLLPGIQKLLDSCKQQGIKIGLASASKNAGYVVARLGIEGYFDTIVDAAKVAKGKPDPEIFMTAAEQLKVPCAHCVGIEDAEAGIEAIQAAGMFAVGVGEAHAMRKADFRVGDTSELTLERIIHKFKSHQ